MESSSLARDTKKARTDASEHKRDTKFPDGDFLLVINHFLFGYNQGFPENWEHGEPFVNFEADFLEEIQPKRRTNSWCHDEYDDFWYH